MLGGVPAAATPFLSPIMALTRESEASGIDRATRGWDPDAGSGLSRARIEAASREFGLS